MKPNSGLTAHDDGENKLLVPTGATNFSGLVRSNPTTNFLISCLENETTEDEAVAKMQKKWDVSDETARRDVQKKRKAAQRHRRNRRIIGQSDFLPRSAATKG